MIPDHRRQLIRNQQVTRSSRVAGSNFRNKSAISSRIFFPASSPGHTGVTSQRLLERRPAHLMRSVIIAQAHLSSLVCLCA